MKNDDEKKKLLIPVAVVAKLMGETTKAARKLLIHEKAARQLRNGRWVTTEDRLLDAFPEIARRLRAQRRSEEA